MDAPAAPRATKRSRAERDALLLASRDATDAALEAAVFGSLGGGVGTSGRAASSSSSAAAAAAAVSGAASGGAPRAAWRDEDDEAVEVDVAAVSRLRKLRTAPGETMLRGEQLSERLRQRFAAASSGGVEAPAWARLPAARGRPRRRAGEEEEEDSAEEAAAAEEEEGDSALRGGGEALLAASAVLPARRLNITRVRDANRAEPSRAVVRSLGWHPGGALLFTAGLDKTLRFFAVDGRRNAKVASVHLPDLPITSAAWAAGGSEVLLAGRRPFFASYNVETGATTLVPRLSGSAEKSLESMVVSPGGELLAFLGNSGALLLACARTKQRVATLKMNGSARAAAFARGGDGSFSRLLSAGSHGEVYSWDLRTMTCAERHADEGSAGTTAIAVAPCGSRYAVGAASGVVNVYADAEASGGGSGGGGSGGPPPRGVRGLFASAAPRAPLHCIMNLTSPVSTLAYGGGSGEVLAAASDDARDALKLVHCASGSVFANWPTARTPLHYVSAVAFSPASGFLAIGNDRGRVLLYRLNHYDRA